MEINILAGLTKIAIKFFVFGLAVVFGNYLSSKGLPENYKCKCEKRE